MPAWLEQLDKHSGLLALLVMAVVALIQNNMRLSIATLRAEILEKFATKHDLERLEDRVAEVPQPSRKQAHA
jgi:hypothetical protein